MKEEAHPDYHPVIFKDGEHEVTTRSTLTSKKTREVDGVEHYVISVDISAFTHPFYTGKQKLVDTEGRVDRFMKRYNLTTSEEKAAAGAKGEEPGDEEAEEQAEEATEESAEEATEESAEESAE